MSKTTKPAKTPKSKAPKVEKPRKPSGLDAAAKVLAEAGAPMHCKAMVEQMLAKGYETCGQDGGDLPVALFGGHLCGIGRVGAKGHRRSPERGDARNDLRFAAGSGAWQLDAGPTRRRSPHLLTTGFRSEMVG